MKHPGYILLTSVIVIVLLLSAVLISHQPFATAQDGGGVKFEIDDFYKTPATSTGNAEWTILEPTFESHYPDGFTFTIHANSDQGDIVAATAYFSHAPGKQKHQSAEYDPESGQFVATWLPDTSLPPWIAVNYHWRFTDSEGNTYRTEWFMGEEYVDHNRVWQRAESDDLIIFLQEGLDERAIDETLAAMDAQRETYRQAWGGLLSYKPRVVLFADRETFNEWRIGFASRSDVQLAGQTSSDWGATVQIIIRDDIIDLAWSTVLHEIAHLYQAEFTKRAGLSGAHGWWTEGQASLFELTQSYDYEQRVRSIAVRGELDALFEGAGPNPSGNGPDAFPRYGYDVGFTFFRWLVTNYGLDGHRQIMDAIRDGATVREAVEKTTHLSITEVESAWRQWLGASAAIPTLLPTPTIEWRFPPTVIPQNAQ